jgi:hypothetical protein
MSYTKVVRNNFIFLNMHRNYMFCTLFQKLWPVEILLILHQLQAYTFEKGSEHVISILALVPYIISNTLMVHTWGRCCRLLPSTAISKHCCAGNFSYYSYSWPIACVGKIFINLVPLLLLFFRMFHLYIYSLLVFPILHLLCFFLLQETCKWCSRLIELE